MSTRARKQRKWWHIMAVLQLRLNPGEPEWERIERENRFEKPAKR